jgi:ribose/xylose/arabinose/galactoside ABC-type transport system permease subunit
MSDETAAGAATQPARDERVAFRGPIQRLLLSPEIGAMIGAVVVWTFFWGAGEKFGNVSTLASYLDVAAPLGIMAVAVALLMIGGEFDLSAGMMTGATGILVALMARSFMGDGASLWLAIPAAFVAAGCIGWLNGTLVNRTGLPSFIVTLATFFVLRGANLVFSKRLAGKVTVDGVDDAAGYEFFRKVFASVHNRETFGLRDPLFLILCIAGAALICWSLLEQSLVRRDAVHATALPVLGVGVAAAIGGLIVLHQTDGVGGNVVGCLLGGVGVVAAVDGFARWRYEPREGDGTASVAGSERQVGLGVGLGALAVITIFAIDRKEQEEVLTWLPSWARVVLGVAAAAVGVALAARFLTRSLRDEESQKKVSPAGWVRIVFLIGVIGLVTMVATLSLAQLVTMQAFRTLVVVILAALGVLTLLRARGQVGVHSPRGQLAVGLLTTAAVVALAFATRSGSGAERFRAGLFGAIVLGAIGIAANTFVEAGLRKRQEAHPAADKLGARLGYAGAGLLAIGFFVRVFFTGENFRISVMWWLLATAIATFTLLRTKYGNWIFAVGGNKEAARAIGVPANNVKVALFMTTSLAGCFAGMMIALRFTSVQSSQGLGEEFEYIIAAVVGGNLLTGGYGSAAGAAIGAIVMAMSQIGIPFAGWNQDGRFVFIGGVLLLAVLVNNFVRRKAQEAR